MTKLVFWLFSHNLTNTGAPLVLASIVRELVSFGRLKQLKLVSWGGLHDRRHSQLQHQLAAEGVAVQVLDPQQLAQSPRPGDRVLLNSLALPELVLDQALSWLEQGLVPRLDWYAHEGDPWVWLPGSQWPQRLQRCLQNGGLQLRVPSARTLEIYGEWLGGVSPGLSVQAPRLELPDPLPQVPARDPGVLKLQLTGMAGCGQKGHLWVLRWLEQALAQRPQGSAGLRDLQLQFIGLETGTYAAFSRELIRRGEALLGSCFSWVEHGSREQALAAMAGADFALSCSLSETFSLVAAEAMALGQPLLRNRTGGWQEQLQQGITGFDLGEPGPELRAEQVQLLQQLRDPQWLPAQQLDAMGQQARERARSFQQLRYSPWLLGGEQL